jgi:HEPN domain-containing protein
VQAELVLLNPAFGLARYPDAEGTPPVDAVGVDDATRHLASARRDRKSVV